MGTISHLHRSGGKVHLRRAIAVIWTAITMAAVLGFAALAIDMGHLYVVKTQMQSAADASALAGVSAMARPGGAFNYQTEETAAEARVRAMDYVSKNAAAGEALQLDPDHIDVGRLDSPELLQYPLAINNTPYNAVRVRLQKGEDSTNSPVNLFFARIWGKETADMSVTATAYLDGRFAGYRPIENKKGPLLPVTVRTAKFEYEVVSGMGGDNFGYDPVTGQITSGPDGITELTIYPERQNDFTPGCDGAGNFGILNINSDSCSADVVAGQIRNGLTPDDFLGEFGTEELLFYRDSGLEDDHDVDGVPPIQIQTYDIEGNPGLMTSLRDDFEARLGEVIGFFTHDQVVATGSNAVFTITSMQFGRLVEVQLTGNPENKRIVVQPTAYVGMEIITHEEAAPHWTAGRLRLVR